VKKTMTITLKPDLKKFVDKQVRLGRFKSPDAAVAHALKRLRDDEQKIAWLRKEIQKGINSLDRGEGTPWDVDEAKARLLRRLKRQHKET
jgi:putative addiction module CopG family antidote